MANVTNRKLNGTVGNPNSKSFVLQGVVDFAEWHRQSVAAGDALAVGDTWQLFDIPAWSAVTFVGGGGVATINGVIRIDVGPTGDADNWMDGVLINSSVGPNNHWNENGGFTAPSLYGGIDTPIFLTLSEGTASSGKIRIFALCHDVGYLGDINGLAVDRDHTSTV